MMPSRGVLLLLAVLTAASVAVFTLSVPRQDREADARGLSAAGQVGQTPRAAALERRLDPHYGGARLYFEANQGQTDPRVKFLSRAAGYVLFLTPEGALFRLPDAADAVFSKRAVPGPGSDRGERFPVFDAQAAAIDPINPKFWLQPVGGQSRPALFADLPARSLGPSGSALQMRLLGGHPSPDILGVDELPAKSHYLTGNDPARWQTGVSTYAKVTYRNVYPGIDWVWYGSRRQLEFDFLVSPGVDPEVIRFSFQAGESLTVDDETGDLVVGVGGGQIRLRSPTVYQVSGGVRKGVAGGFVVDKGEVGFQLGPYDAAIPLVIDPAIIYSTYLGGGGADHGYAIAVDAAVNAYVAGSTSSVNFPVMGAPQGAFGGDLDAFVTKLDINGQIVYSTYLGGSDFEEAYGIAVDSAGRACITGVTFSSTFPTANAMQTVLKGEADAFLVKMNAAGNGFVFSTYHCGSMGDDGQGIALDSSGNIYVMGGTSSADFPKVNPIPGATTGFYVSKFNPSGSTLVYSTPVMSGVGTEAFAVDPAGSAYVAGSTSTPGLPVVNAVQPVYGGGGDDAFVLKLNPTGNALVYATYLGGSESDSARGIAADSAGSAYVVGTTSSDNFPTVSALQPAHGGGFSDMFISKLSPSGSALIYSTYLGGSGDEGSPSGIAVDPGGSAYITGVTISTNFPLASPIQPALGGIGDVVVSQLSAAGDALLFSTYLGGSSSETARRIALDAAGAIYIVGDVIGGSPGFPLRNAAQDSYGGGFSDAFVAKISAAPTPPTPIPTLSEWGMILLAVLLVGAGIWRVCRRRVAA